MPAGQMPAEPLEDGVEALDAVGRPARAGELVPLAREEQQLGRGAAALEGHEEPVRLLDRAAPVLLRVDDQHGYRDAVGVGQRALPLELADVERVGEEPA